MSSEATSLKHVREQAEKIIDEGSGTYRDVIVRMSTGVSEARSQMVEHASNAIRSRSMALSPRDVLPDRAHLFREIKGKTVSAAQRRKLRPQSWSSAAQVALAGGGMSKAAFRAKTRTGFNALKKHESVQKALDRRASKKKPKEAKDVERDFFWASSSAFLQLGKDELHRFAQESEDILDIYPNRSLRVPAVVRVKKLPANVADNKASAWGVNAIGALAAWGAYGARGAGVKVGVLDTGIDATHPDLAGKLDAFAEFDSSGQIAGTAPRDSDQHGTHVCGTIVGGNNSGKWIGVAPDAKLAVALVLDGAVGGTDAQVLAGIDWALEQDVHVISMSLGALTFGPETPNTYHEAIVSCLLAGVPVVTAIGNEGGNTTGSPGNDLFAFSVGATDFEDRAAGFSGGRTQVLEQSNFIDPSFLPLPYSKPEISAPGVAVESSIPGGQWDAFNGTSMATPHVSGAAALVLSATNRLSSVDDNQRAFLLQDFLLGSVEELGESGQDHRYGFGRLDVLRAIGFARDQGF